MELALWVIAGLLALACYLLFLILGAILKLYRLTMTVSDMNDENQRRVWSCVRRLHMVEYVVRDIRAQRMVPGARFDASVEDSRRDEQIRQDERDQEQMRL